MAIPDEVGSFSLTNKTELQAEGKFIYPKYYKLWYIASIVAALAENAEKEIR